VKETQKWAPNKKGLGTTDLHDIQNNARQHMKQASDRMKTRYDRLANCAAYHEGDKVRLYRPTRTKGESPKLQSSRDGPDKIVT
jgi:hypothetical protein